MIGCVMLFAHSNTAQSIDITEQTLFYAVTYQKYKAGELEIIIERSEGQLKTTVTSHFSNLAKLFLSNSTIETWFNMMHGKISLQRGHFSGNNKTGERSFVIDYQQPHIKLQPTGKQIPINTTDIFESAAFPMMLITSDIQSIAGQTVQETSSKGISEYVYLTPQQQTLELDGRQFETWKITRQKPTDLTRTVTVWLDQNNQQIPVKIASSRKGKETIITLLSKS